MASEGTPFDSIEGTQEYLALLIEAIQDAREDVCRNVERAGQDGARTTEALRLVEFKLCKLQDHVVACRRILNDLALLRRVLETPETRAATGE